MLYPQNGERIVAIDSVTSRHPMYIVSQITNIILDDITILQVNCTQEKPCALRGMFFFKLYVRRKSIVTPDIIVRLS